MERRKNFKGIIKETLSFDIKFEHQSLLQLKVPNLQSGNAGRGCGLKNKKESDVENYFSENIKFLNGQLQAEGLFSDWYYEARPKQK